MARKRNPKKKNKAVQKAVQKAVRPVRMDEAMDRAFAGGAPKQKNVRVMTGGKIESVEAPVIIRKTGVAWGIPCDEVMYSKFFQYFVKHANFMPWDAWIATESTYIPKARNFIWNAFLLESDLPYLMMLDSDIMFPPNLVDILMAKNLPIVGGWYKDKNEPGHPPVVYDFVERDDGKTGYNRKSPGKGLQQVDAMGAGCWLVKREVAEAVGESPFTLVGEGSNWGEDMLFCKRLKEAGIPLHVDWDIALAHVGVGFV